MVEDSGQCRMSLMAPFFASPCRLRTAGTHERFQHPVLRKVLDKPLQRSYESMIEGKPFRCYLPIDMSVKINTALLAIVDDDESMRAAIENLLSSVGIKVMLFEAVEKFLVAGLQNEIACLVSDNRMPGMYGL